MKQQQTAAVLAGGVAERARHTRELIGELKAIRLDLQDLRPKPEITRGWEPPPRDGAIDDACEALEARELEIRNEIRKMQGRPPVVSVERQTGREELTGGSHTEFVEHAPDAPPTADRES